MSDSKSIKLYCGQVVVNGKHCIRTYVCTYVPTYDAPAQSTVSTNLFRHISLFAVIHVWCPYFDLTPTFSPPLPSLPSSNLMPHLQ